MRSPDHERFTLGLWWASAGGSGLAAIAVGAAIATTNYIGLPGALAMNWSRLLLAIAVFTVVGGVSIGLGLGGGMWLACVRTRDPSSRRVVAGAALGGALGAIAPGVLGIAGFGSLTGPYAGTANILGSTLIAATLFVGLWAPHLRDRGPRALWARLGLALVAAVVCAATVAVLGWTLVTTLQLVPSFAWMKHTAHAMGLVPFAVVTSALVGAAGGAFVGAATSLYLSMCAVTGRPGRPGQGRSAASRSPNASIAGP